MLTKTKKLSVHLCLVALIVFSALLLSSCASTTDKSSDTPATEPSPSSTHSDSHYDEVYQATGELLKQNYNLFFNIYSLNQLTLDMPDKKDDLETIFPVKDDTFKSFSDLERYVRSTYMSSTADSLLHNGMYIARNGKLFGDMSKFTGGSYAVDWNNYRYEVSNIKDDSATVTIHVTENTPNAEGIEQKSDVTLTGTVVKENGVWLLEQMVK